MIRLRLSLCQKQGLRQDKRRMAFVVADFSIHCKINWDYILITVTLTKSFCLSSYIKNKHRQAQITHLGKSIAKGFRTN